MTGTGTNVIFWLPVLLHSAAGNSGPVISSFTEDRAEFHRVFNPFTQVHAPASPGDGTREPKSPGWERKVGSAARNNPGFVLRPDLQ